MWQVIFFSLLLKTTVIKRFDTLREAQEYRAEIGKGIILNGKFEEVRNAN